MVESPITFSSRGAELAGSLVLPASGTGADSGAGIESGTGAESGAGIESVPAAVIIAGSGPLDRDGSHARMKLGISRDLSTILARHGWASLRFDKRGIGASGGDYLSAGFYDELADVEAAVGHLLSLLDVGPLVAIGHSAGAMQAAELAARRNDLDGAVLLSTSTQRGEEILLSQGANAAKHLVPRPVRRLLRLLGTSVEDRQEKAIAKLRATTADVARIQLVKMNAKWMREFLDYDPAVAIANAKVPLLAITGTKDIQVDADDLAELEHLAPTRVETHRIGDLDHVLRREPKLVSNPRHYRKQVQRPIDERVTSALLSWLDGLGPTGRPGSLSA